MGYDHGYDEEVFYLGLTLDPAYVEGFVEAAWRGSVRTIQRRSDCSGTSGKTRPSEMW